MAKSSKKSKEKTSNATAPIAPPNPVQPPAVRDLPEKPVAPKPVAAKPAPVAAKGARKKRLAGAGKPARAVKTLKAGEKSAQPAGTAEKPAPAEFAVSEDQIRMRAYFISQDRMQRGISGDSAGDWVEARRQLLQEAAHQP